jgi:hypothetical protein
MAWDGMAWDGMELRGLRPRSRSIEQESDHDHNCGRMTVSHFLQLPADELVWKEDMKDEVEEDDEWEECSVESEDDEDAPELVSLAPAKSKKGKASKAAVNVRHSRKISFFSQEMQ